MRVPPAQSLTESATRASARSRSRSRSSRVTRVSRVPNTNDSVRTSDAADRAWTKRSSSREWRSIEPEMSHSTTSERGSRDRPPPDPRHELAAGAEVAPEHRARREPPAVRVELVAARPAPLEPRHQQVDQPLRLAQLGRASSGRTRGGAGPRPASRRRATMIDALDRPRRRRRRRRRSGSAMPRSSGCSSPRSVAGLGLGRAGAPPGPRRSPPVARQRRRAEVRRAGASRGAATSGRTTAS